MSTTRWIIWCEEHGSANPYRLSSVCESFLRGIHMGDEAPQELTTDCQLVERVVVDPANLPPESIERVAHKLADHDTVLLEDAPEIYLPLAETAITAFLSDSEETS